MNSMKNRFLQLLLPGVFAFAVMQGSLADEPKSEVPVAPKQAVSQEKEAINSSKPDAKKAAEVSVPNPLLSILTDKAYLKAKSRQFDPEKLLKDYMAQRMVIQQGKIVETKLYIEQTKDNILAILSKKGTSEIKGYIKYNIKTDEVEMNFGLDYGYVKTKLKAVTAAVFERHLRSVKNYFDLPDTKKAVFFYDTKSFIDKKTKKPSDSGSLKLEIGDFKKEYPFSVQDKKVISASFAIWFLVSKSAEQVQQEQNENEEAQKSDLYDKTVKKYKKYSGAFTLYQDKNQMFIELPEKDLGRMFVLQAMVHSSGAAMPARPGDTPLVEITDLALDVFKWEKRGRVVSLRRPNIKNRWKKGGAIEKACKMSFPEAIIHSFPIVHEHPKKKLFLLNASSLFFGKINKLDIAMQFAAQGYSLDMMASMPESVKSFPANTVVRMDLHYSGSAKPGLFEGLDFGDGLRLKSRLEDRRSLGLKVTYNMWYYKKSNYMPRLADPRIGYFTSDHTNIEKLNKFEHTVKHIYRFNLKKRYPKLDLSEPVKPIKWMIDPSVPKEYRPAIRKGILDWNLAFEKAGFKNAIVVEDAPTNDPNWDHADGRYNVVRWVVDDFVCSALPRIDPFTGEILSASINMDATILKVFGAVRYPYFLKNNALGLAPAKKTTGNRFEAALKQWSTKHKCSKHPFGCQHSLGMKQNLTLAAASMDLLHKNKKEKKKLFDQAIRSFVRHECGHALGLRHNFKGATLLTNRQLADENVIAQFGSTGSVMDYVPANVHMLEKKGKYYFSPKVGPYDIWAIQYGYTPIGGVVPEAELPKLKEIASKSGLWGHDYATDEDMMTNDPYVQTWIFGKDPINYAKKYIQFNNKMRNRLMKDFSRWGKDYGKNTFLLMNSIESQVQVGVSMSKFIGGIERSRTLPGDQGKKSAIKPVSAKLQREAVQFIINDCFNVDKIKIPDSVKFNMSTGYTATYNPFWNAPLRDIMHNIQAAFMGILTHPMYVFSLNENAYKQGGSADTYRLTEHFKYVHNAAYSSMSGQQDVTPLQRDLQHFSTQLMMDIAGINWPMSISGLRDIKLVAMSHVKMIKSKADARLRNPVGLSEISRLHLMTISKDIDNFLKKKTVDAKLSF